MKNRKIVQPIALLVVLIIADLLLYALMLRPAQRRLGTLRKEESKAEKISGQYNNIPLFNQQLEAQKNTVVSVIGRSLPFISSSDKTDQSYWEDLMKISEQAGIKTNKISPVEADTRHGYTLGFNATHQQVLSLLSRAERSFRVEEMSLTRNPDGTAGTCAADLVLFPIITSTNETKATPADFMELFNATTDRAKDIARKEPAELVSLPRRDIFVLGKTREAEKKEKEVRPPQVRVDGIFYDSDTPMVSIDGKLLREGAVFNGLRIEKIKESSVVVDWHGRPFTLKTTKEE